MNVEHHFGGGVYAKETRLPAGYSMGKHVHQHDHLSMLGSGFALLTVDGVSREIRGPACITVEAGKVHEVKALTAITWFCIHATDETEPGKIDEALINE